MEVFEKGNSFVEADFLTKTGDRISHYLTGNKTRIDGKIYLLGMGIDTSELKKSERERKQLLHNMGERVKELELLQKNLKKNEDRFRAFYELGLVGLAITSPEKGWIMANERLCDTLGYTIDELREMTWAQLTHPEDLELDARQFERLLAAEIDGYSLEKRFIRKTGEVMFTNLVVRCVRNDDASIDYIIAMVEDITEKKQSEISLKETLKNLERSNRELEQFAYVASHDLQEPLRMVASYVQLLELRYAEKLDTDARDFIKYAVDGATRMKTLINDLLAFSRVETRGKDLEITDMSLVMGEVIVELRSMIEKNQVIITNDELPEILADKGQIRQLFRHFIDNAIKFSGDHPPHIHISAKKNSDKEWLFSFKDNGIGIDPQFFDRIFIIFQRLHGKDEYSGTGVGLAICKRIVERHGGKIWVESEPGKGATFYFTLTA
jgi:PAS domain S-box-containing protein